MSEKSVQKQSNNKSLIDRIQSASFRNFAFGAGLILVELILAARYGSDTFRLALHEHQAEWTGTALWIPTALATLDVLLIDCTFLLMLVIAKYSGTSEKAGKQRVATTIGAIIMFVGMMLVATRVLPVMGV